MKSPLLQKQEVILEDTGENGLWKFPASADWCGMLVPRTVLPDKQHNSAHLKWFFFPQDNVRKILRENKTLGKDRYNKEEQKNARKRKKSQLCRISKHLLLAQTFSESFNQRETFEGQIFRNKLCTDLSMIHHMSKNELSRPAGQIWRSAQTKKLTGPFGSASLD